MQDGATVLDLGCGTGRDAYVAAQLVGSAGLVIGLDMTEEQLTIARAHQEWYVESHPQTRTLRLQSLCLHCDVSSQRHNVSMRTRMP